MNPMRQRAHLPHDNEYQIPFRVPDHYSKPMDIVFQRMVEPVYNVQSSMSYLQEYEPETPAMKKAKAFLAKFEKYNANPEAREAIRQQYKPEIDILRARVWKVHITALAVKGITSLYNDQQRVPVALPEEFQDLSYYAVLQPEDSRNPGTFRVIQRYIEVCEGHNLEQPLNGDLGEIQNRFPEKVEELKKLLWERHLAKKERVDIVNAELEIAFNKMNKQKKLEALVYGSTVISAAVSVIFMTLAFVINPFLGIPTAIFFTASVAIPSIFYFRSNK